MKKSKKVAIVASVIVFILLVALIIVERRYTSGVELLHNILGRIGIG